MALSAADLQRRHELEGAPDPFPSLTDQVPTKKETPPTLQDLDTDSQAAFPSLASATPVTASKATWGASNGPRIKPAVSKVQYHSDSFTLSAIDLSTAGKDGKQASLAEVMKQVSTKYKVKLEASANQKNRHTTFYIKAESAKELDKAKRSLLALLSPVITIVINAPTSTIPSIIGPKGSKLKEIRDQTSVRVDIPRKDSLTAPNGNGNADGASSGKVTPSHDEEDEITVPVTLIGPQPLVYEAQAMINEIIASKTSKTTQRVKDIPTHVLPFVLSRKASFEAAAEGKELSLSLNRPAREIVVTGDRDAVVRVVDTIKASIETFKSSLQSLKIALPKRQHRLLVGKAVDDVLAKTRCAVVIPKPDDSSDEVVVWGQGPDLPGGLSAVMEQANSQYIHEFPLPGPITLSRQLLTYMIRIQYPKTLMNAHPGVSVFTASESAIEKASSLTVDIVGEKSLVDNVVRKVSELIGKLIGATAEVSIDWLVHRFITGKHAKKLKQFHDNHNVNVYFPPETAEQSSVLLVYDPLSPNASPSPDEKKRHLDEVTKELQKLTKDAADVKSETISVEKRWHEAVVGQGGTTLNAIIGEDKALSIKVGTEVGDGSNENVILVRGPSSDVDRAVKEILKIVDDAKNDEIVNSFSVEFEIDREYVGRIVGAQGAGVNKLRDQLGVKLDVSDEVDEKEKDGAKKKKAAHQRSKVKITGRKENVEEAKKRILTQIERLADETSEVLKIPSQYHSSLIGAGGKYAIRLEEKYGVKITFPRQSAENGEGKTREPLKADEVLVKGGKKGVAGAKSELLEAVEFEKESNNVIKFTIPTRTVSRVLGKSGASIQEIKNNTDTQIDVDTPKDSDTTNISIRGTKKNIATAKESILAIADQIAEEVTITISVEPKYHRTLIGAGGQGLRDLATRIGLQDADPKLLAGLIRFPRAGDSSGSDEVRIRGEPKLVEKVKVEIEKTINGLRNRVILAVEVPAAQHRVLIGRSGHNLEQLQKKTHAQVQFPGSRSYAGVGEAENADEFKDVDLANIVKVTGTREACLNCIAELKASIKPAPAPAVTDTIEVPLKYHHAISQQGQFFRNLRNYGVQVEQSAHPTKSAVPTQPPPANGGARIDEADSDSVPGAQWQVIANYQDAEEGNSTWTLKAKNQADLERARKAVMDAIEQAERMSHVGFLTMPDRSLFPRIVGSKGANVARLRNETGADITVSKENSTIVIIGSESDIVLAKEAILKMPAEGSRSRRN